MVGCFAIAISSSTKPDPSPSEGAAAALVNFTKGLADLGAPSNILVTAVSPTATKTERWDQLMEQEASASGRSVEAVPAEA